MSPKMKETPVKREENYEGEDEFLPVVWSLFSFSLFLFQDSFSFLHWRYLSRLRFVHSLPLFFFMVVSLLSLALYCQYILKSLGNLTFSAFVFFPSVPFFPSRFQPLIEVSTELMYRRCEKNNPLGIL